MQMLTAVLIAIRVYLQVDMKASLAKLVNQRCSSGHSAICTTLGLALASFDVGDIVSRTSSLGNGVNSAPLVSAMHEIRMLNQETCEDITERVQREKLNEPMQLSMMIKEDNFRMAKSMKETLTVKV